MKRIALSLMICSLSFYANAQSRVAIGFELAKYAVPEDWREANWDVKNYNEQSPVPGQNFGLWVGWFYAQKLSVKLSYNYIGQTALPTHPRLAYGFEGVRREIELYELSVGYNLLHKQSQKLGLWSYAGIGMADRNSYQVYSKTVEESLHSEGGIRYIKHPVPSVQVQFKYNPVRWFHCGVGGTYRYVFSNFQPLAANFSVGLDI